MAIVSWSTYPWAFRSGALAAGAAALALILLSACGGGGSSTSTLAPVPTIASFAPNPGIITVGDATGLTAVFSNGNGRIMPGGLTITSGVAVPVSPATSTTYTLTVTSPTGVTAQHATQVTVVAAPDLPVVHAPTYVTAGTTGLTAWVPVQFGCTYAWSIIGGNITAGTTADQVLFTAGASGLVELDCTVTNAAGTGRQNSANCTIVAVLTAPVVAAPDYVTANRAGYVATASAADATSYAWTVGGASVTGGAGTSSITFTPYASGTVTFNVVASNAASLTSAPGIGGSTIVPAPDASITAPAKVTANRVGAETASVPSQADMTCAWSIGSGAVTAGAGTRSITFTPGANGTVTLGVTVTNLAHTAATGSTTCAIVAVPAITGFAPSQPSIGAGSSLSLVSAFSAGSGTITPGPITVPASGATTVTPSATTTYTLTVANGADTPATVTAQARVVVGSLALLGGVPSGSGNVQGAGPAARFYGPSSAVFDAAGNVYVADQRNHVIGMIAPDGTTRILAGVPDLPGSNDGPGALASFRDPTGVAVDPSSGSPARRIYVADTGNHKIRLITVIGGVAAVSTLAGDPSNSAGTANGTPGAFNAPEGITVDSAGTVWVADTGASTIRSITPGGVVATFAGSPGVAGHADSATAPATFNHPAALAVDGAGYLFVADSGNNLVRMITPAGVVSTYSGTYNGGLPGNADGTTAGFWNPRGIALDGAGWVYLADTSNQIIRVITPRASVDPTRSYTVIGHNTDSGYGDGLGLGSEFSLPPAGAYFDYPTTVAVNAAANTLAIADFGNNCIRLVPVFHNTDGSSQGEPVNTDATHPGSPTTTLAGTAHFRGAYCMDSGSPTLAARFSHPTGLALDLAGNLYVADTDNNAIRRITSAGTVSTFAGPVPGSAEATQSGFADGAAASARFYGPAGVAVDRSALATAGTVYVADTGNNRVRMISGGTVSSFADTDLDTPLGIDVASGTGTVYVADTFHNRIKAYPAGGGSPTVLAGGTLGFANGSGTAARFYLPFGIAVDNGALATAGTIYVADTYNHCIRAITPGGTVTTLAGSGTAGFADGFGTAAQFNLPNALGVDPGTGKVYVADTYNHVIRVIDPGTRAVVTLAGVGGTGIELPGNLPAKLAFPFAVVVDPGLTAFNDTDGASYHNPDGSLLISVQDAILASPF